MIYEYECEKCGNHFEVMKHYTQVKPIGKDKQPCPACDAMAPRVLSVPNTPPPKTTSGRWSASMGCHPDQIPEQQRKLAAAGCSDIRHNERGELWIANEKTDRTKKSEALGLFDPNGGVGSPRRKKDRAKRWH